MSPSLKDIAYQYIREGVETGRIPAGQRLSEVDVSHQLGTSRGPVREAMSQLASEGLVEQVPGHGVHVRVPDRKELEDLYQLRQWLEGAAAEDAAAAISADNLASMTRTLAEMETLTETVLSPGTDTVASSLMDEFRRRDLEFHAILLRSVGNEEVLRLINNLRLLTRLFGPRKEDPRETIQQRLGRTIAEHRAIIASLHARDAAEARRLMRLHIVGAREHALARLDWEQAADKTVPSEVEATGDRSMERVLNRIQRYKTARS